MSPMWEFQFRMLGQFVLVFVPVFFLAYGFRRLIDRHIPKYVSNPRHYVWARLALLIPFMLLLWPAISYFMPRMTIEDVEKLYSTKPVAPEAEKLMH